VGQHKDIRDDSSREDSGPVQGCKRCHFKKRQCVISYYNEKEDDSAREGSEPITGNTVGD